MDVHVQAIPRKYPHLLKLAVTFLMGDGPLILQGRMRHTCTNGCVNAKRKITYGKAGVPRRCGLNIALTVKTVKLHTKSTDGQAASRLLLQVKAYRLPVGLSIPQQEVVIYCYG